MIRKLIVILGNLGVIAAFIVAFSIMAAMKPKPEEQEPRSLAPTAFVEEVSYSPTTLKVYAQGEVSPKHEITLTSQVGGKITSVSNDFAAGGVIREGDVLIQIEDADYRLAVTRARAQVATARQSLEIAKAEAELARKDYEELSGLTDGDSPSDLTLRRPQLARAEAEYQSALANVQEAELALSRTKIRAPFNGRVRSIAANTGQFVSPGYQLGRIFSSDVAEIRLPLTDEDLSRLDIPLAFNDQENGPIVTLTANVAGKDRLWKGQIVRVDAAIDSSTRQISAIVEVKDPYGAAADNGFPLAMGLFVNAEIEGPSLASAAIVPRSALQNDSTVYTLTSDNIVEQKSVTVVARTAEGVIITEGLEEGDRVVVSRLTAPVGSKVRPLDPDNPTFVEEEAEESDDDTVDGSRATTAQGSANGNSGAK